MTSINSDQMSSMVLASLNKSNSEMKIAMERLSTGKRINAAGDDAAGLSISSKLRAQVDSLNAAIKNSSDALAMVSTIEGALVETTSILQRMRTLAVQSSSDTNTGNDRTYLQDEVNQLITEINRIFPIPITPAIIVAIPTISDKSVIPFENPIILLNIFFSIISGDDANEYNSCSCQ